MMLGSGELVKQWVGPNLYGILLVITSAASFGAMAVLAPVVVVLLAALLLGEAVEPLRLVGGLLILLTVVFLARTELAGAQTIQNAKQE